MTQSIAEDPPPQPPEPPGENECCESGCEACVWTVYQEAKLAYERAYADWLLRHAEALHDDRFWNA